MPLGTTTVNPPLGLLGLLGWLPLRGEEAGTDSVCGRLTRMGPPMVKPPAGAAEAGAGSSFAVGVGGGERGRVEPRLRSGHRRGRSISAVQCERVVGGRGAWQTALSGGRGAATDTLARARPGGMRH